MADAKIVIKTATDDEGLKRLKAAFAEGSQKAAELKQQLKDLNKTTRNGTKATTEQRQALKDLRMALHSQKEANAAYSRAIKDTTKSIEAASQKSKEAAGGFKQLLSSFRGGSTATTAFSVALGNALVSALSAVVDIAKDAATHIVSVGLAAQQTTAQLGAIKNNINSGKETYRIFNDLERDLNYDSAAVQEMGIQLLAMGYTAQESADMIRLCADAAAGLGKKQEGAEMLVTTLARIRATGDASSRQIIALQMAGINLDDVFESVGMTGEEAMKALDDGMLDAQDAIQALTDYLHQFDGSMAKSKQNIVDQWGDVTGNINAACGEIGAAILDAFQQSGIVQELIDITQDLVDFIRGDGLGVFTLLGNVAGVILWGIDAVLAVIKTSIEAIYVIIYNLAMGFSEVGKEIVDSMQPVIDVLKEIYNFAAEVLRILGRIASAAASGIHRQYKIAAAGGVNNDEEEAALANATHGLVRESQRFNSSGGSAKRSGGGGGSHSGGGSAVKKLTEEEKAVEALIKKYADADKQKWALAKSAVELAQVSVKMMTKEEQKTEGLQVTLQGLKNAHDQLVEGYTNELKLAQKITDASTRDKTIKAINDQIDAENSLYAAKVRAAQFDLALKNNEENTKNLVDRILGDPDSTKYKIDQLKKTLQENLKDLDTVISNPDEADALTGVAKLLQMPPDALVEELTAKGETLQSFVDQYKAALAEAADAEIQQLTTAQQWHDKIVGYMNDVGKSMGSAMSDFITGAKSGKEALADFAKNIINTAVSILTEWLGVFAIYSAFPTWASGMTPADMANKTVFGITKKAAGGYITGPGTGTSDSIPAMLSKGEYVIRSAAVDRIGVGMLNAINAGATPEFSDGGGVDDNAGGDVNLSVSALDAKSFMDFLNRGGLKQIKQALHENNRNFATDSGVW